MASPSAGQFVPRRFAISGSLQSSPYCLYIECLVSSKQSQTTALMS